MGWCSVDTLVAGCGCCNAAIVCPPNIGCSCDVMLCCADVKCCLGAFTPAACCCCGPTCVCNKTIIKVQGVFFCCDIQVSCPCDSDTPIIITPLPFCSIYPKTACCATRASVVKSKAKDDKAKGENGTEMDQAKNVANAKDVPKAVDVQAMIRP